MASMQRCIDVDASMRGCIDNVSVNVNVNVNVNVTVNVIVNANLGSRALGPVHQCSNTHRCIIASMHRCVNVNASVNR